MDRRLLVLLVAVVALIGVVNATVYAYRWMTGTINIAGPDQATGAACTGFYSSAAQSGINLPSAGTNYNAPTYGGNGINVTTGDVVCEWTIDSNKYFLYESITVTINVTVGSWYIHDFYGFGFKNNTGDPVYVYFRVETPATGLTSAYLRIYNATDGSFITSLNLTESGDQTSAITLYPNKALKLSLFFDAPSAGTVSFKIGVYVSQTTETPP